MKIAILTKKLLMGLGLVGSVVVSGSIYQSMQVNSISYMQDTEIKFVKRFDEAKERFVASSQKDLAPKIALHYLPVNDENLELINTEWKIIRIENSDAQEIYNSQKSEKEMIIDMELIKTSQVMINDDKDYLFDISFIHPSGKTIALFRSIDGGFEIIEAVKINKKEEIQPKIEEKVADRVINKPKASEIKQESPFMEPVDLVLERVFIPTVDARVIVDNELFRGNVTIANNSVQGLDISLEKGEKSVSISISDIQLETGGSFVTEIDGQQARGIITGNGKNAFKLRFATGPYKGAQLNFVTYEELERIVEEREEMQRLSEERSYENSVRSQELEVVQTQAANERRDGSVINAGYQNGESNDNVAMAQESGRNETDRQGYSF
jgi:hypothetical protein